MNDSNRTRIATPPGTGPTGLVLMTGLLFALGSGCSDGVDGRGATLADDSSQGVATAQLTQGQRPLIAVVTTLNVPTDVEEKQWVTTAPFVVGLAIPDNQQGITNSVIVPDVSNGACSALLAAEVIADIAHPRPADLAISIVRRGADGSLQASAPLFDGRAASAGMSIAEANKLTIPSPLSVPGTFLVGGDCSHLQLVVSDLQAGNTGTFSSWTLRRRTKAYPLAHDVAFYKQLLFGGRTPNLSDYHREVSRNQFSWKPAGAGVVGPLVDTARTPGTDDSTRVLNAIQLLDKSGFDFRPYDVNKDNVISNTELGVIVFDNERRDGGGVNRSAAADGCVGLVSGQKYCGKIVLASEETDFATLAHEMSHQLGTVDLYGIWSVEHLSDGLTLMGGTITTPDNPRTLFLDPWHRAMLGWYTPVAPALTPYSPSTQMIRLGDESFRDAAGNQSRPAMFTRPDDPSEYYLFEYRHRLGYDADVGDEGIVAWHVKEDGHGNPWRGVDGLDDHPGHAIYAVGPDSQKGAHRAWKSTDGDFTLSWYDGVPLTLKFWVQSAPNVTNSAEVHWAPYPDVKECIDAANACASGDRDLAAQKQQICREQHGTQNLNPDSCVPCHQADVACTSGADYSAADATCVQLGGSKIDPNRCPHYSTEPIECVNARDMATNGMCQAAKDTAEICRQKGGNPALPRCVADGECRKVRGKYICT